jgi:hypothetical protein
LTYVITFRIAFTVYESNKVVFFAISKRIPVKLDGASFPVLGDTISYLDVGITDGYLGKLKDAIARTGMRSMKVTKWYSLPLAREGGSVSCFQCLISVFSPSISSGYHI